MNTKSFHFLVLSVALMTETIGYGQTNKITVQSFQEFERLFCGYLNTYEVATGDSLSKLTNTLFLRFNTQGQILSLHFLDTNYNPQSLMSLFKVSQTIENDVLIENSMGLLVDMGGFSINDITMMVLVIKCE